MDKVGEASSPAPTVRRNSIGLSGQAAAALALADAVELGAEEYTDGVELALGVGVLSRLTPLDLQRLLQRSDAIPVAAGEVVVQQHALARECYLIKQGRAEVIVEAGTSAARVVASKGLGAIFGEEALITDGRRNATVVMTEAGTLLRIAAEDFLALILPSLAAAVDPAQAESLRDQGARWLELGAANECPDAAPGAVACSWNQFRERYLQLSPARPWVVCAAGRGRAVLAAFLLNLAGFEAYALEKNAPGPELPAPLPVAWDAATTVNFRGRAEPPGIPAEAAPVTEPAKRPALRAEPDGGMGIPSDETARIGREDVRAFERQRHERRLLKLQARLEADFEARLAHALEENARSQLLEIQKLQRQLADLRQQNAALLRELAQLRDAGARGGRAGWPSGQALDII